MRLKFKIFDDPGAWAITIGLPPMGSGGGAAEFLGHSGTL